VEEVLVVSRDVLNTCGTFEGFQPIHPKYLPLFNEANHKFVARDLAEHDPSLKQLIPYVVIWGDNGVETYWRGRGMGEQRLHGKRSIGFGGHINPVDAEEGTPYERGLARELEEELIFDPAPATVTPYVIGLINDDSTEVGRVHLGVVHHLDLNATHTIRPREPDILDLEFLFLEELVAHREQFEPWSQFCIDELVMQAQMAASAENNISQPIDGLLL
jgi:predicted NUDIX family phosphoesterase